MASAVHELSVEDANGRRTRAVLRRYVRPELNAEEPDIADREVRTLQFVESLDLPTPVLLGSDTTGVIAGMPSVLMSRLGGRVEWRPNDLDRWLDRVAETLVRIHAAPLPPAGLIRVFAPYPQASYEPPAWSCHPEVWERAIEIVHEAPPPAPARFIHRDFHPGNLLWRRGVLTGVLDWSAASVGPAVMDVAHCRSNLLAVDATTADALTNRWERLSGEAFDPWADVVTIVGFLDDLRSDWRPERVLIEDTLASAVAALAPVSRGGGSRGTRAPGGPRR
jgi:aminoglycoside phosphotransferase (APT) family kinase protein